MKKAFLGLVKLFVKLNLPSMVALIFSISLQKIKSADNNNGKKTIFILPKAGFTEDVLEVCKNRRDLEVISLPRILLHEVYFCFLPFFVDDNNYLSAGSEFDTLKLKYRNFLKKVFFSLSEKKDISVMLTGNFAYSPDRELSAAMSELGIPFIALHKENLKTPGLANFFEMVYRERRGAFQGHSILVYNEVEKDLQIKSGVITPARVQVVGMPRLDDLHQWRKENVGQAIKGRVLFFAFAPETGMPVIMRKTQQGGVVRHEENKFSKKVSGVTDLCHATYETILELAKRNPELEVVIKSKGRERDFEIIMKMMNVLTKAELPPNIRIIHGGSVKELLSECSVVCGFKTTAICEAIAMGKPVVMPWFAEALDANISPYLLDLRNVTKTAYSSSELYALLKESAKKPLPVRFNLSETEISELRKWTGNGDGQARQRTFEAIIVAMEEK